MVVGHLHRVEIVADQILVMYHNSEGVVIEQQVIPRGADRVQEMNRRLIRSDLVVHV
jgi:hypothetical protein